MKRIRLDQKGCNARYFVGWLSVPPIEPSPRFSLYESEAAIMTPEQADAELAAIRAARPKAALVVEDAH
jgi:hypothetical protein